MQHSDAQRVDSQRRPEPHGRVVATAALLISLLVSWGCAAGLAPVAGPPAEFARFSTWDWHPANAAAVAPARAKLAAGLRLAVERELAERGYRRVRTPIPDFFVVLRVEVGLDVEVVWETSAVQTLSSFHASPSFETVSSERVVRAFETGTVSIAIMDPLAREAIWRGRADKRVRHSFAPHAPELVSHLFADFPVAAPANDWLTAGTTPER